MARIANSELIEEAKKVAKLHRVSEDVRIGDVGCALITNKGNVYTGVSIHACCGVGFCAEHSAIADMTKHGEYRIRRIVAVSSEGDVMAPCGRCRELIYQINAKNVATDVIVRRTKVSKLGDLLPDPWQKIFY